MDIETISGEVPLEGQLEPLALAERAELVVAGIYEKLARTCPDNPTLQRLFRHLAQEEREHAKRVRLFAQMWEQRHTDRPRLDTKRVETLVAHAERFLTTIDAISQYDALKSAIALEEDFNAVHAECMAAARDPLLADFFGQLAEADTAHSVLLQHARKDMKFDGTA